MKKNICLNLSIISIIFSLIGVSLILCPVTIFCLKKDNERYNEILKISLLSLFISSVMFVITSVVNFNWYKILNGVIFTVLPLISIIVTIVFLVLKNKNKIN